MIKTTLKDFIVVIYTMNVEKYQETLSPRSIIKNLSEKIPKSAQKKINITEKNFKIPKYSEYNFLINYNYRVPLLKQICRFYKIRITGTKNELEIRIYNFLKLSTKIIIIQRAARNKLVNTYNNLHGPAYIKRHLCVNDTDFFTMENLKDISVNQFISYKDTDDMIYGFDILSLYNLLSKNGRRATNPYNRKPFPQDLPHKINKLLKLSRLFKEPIIIELEKPEQLDPSKVFELKTISLFQEIDNLGNYTDHKWFCDISQSRIQLIRYIRELADIWTYRASLSNTCKREICPPVGDPFRHVNLTLLPNQSLNNLQKISLEIMESMITRGVNDASKSLGANYVLCALTLVNNSAAECLPWLYQSVAPHA